jgi:hypothetical protein
MNSPRNLPRDYQIAELTRDGQLSPPPLSARHLRVISEFLMLAWDELLTSHLTILRTHDEPDINALMAARLNNICDVRPEIRNMVSVVTPGTESTNYNGISLIKRPDLSIHLTRRPSNFPLIVECKIIDKTDAKVIRMYCKDGLYRFVSGDYAWRTNEAFMLAYVRDNSTIENTLTPHLVKHQQKQNIFLTEHLPKPVNIVSHDLAQSRHGRGFPKNPGSIAVWHLWLS